MKIFLFLAGFFIIVYIIATIMIYSYLKEKGERVNFLLIRLMIFSYVNRYKELTRKESGKTGFPFYLWIISINLALISIVLFLIFRA